MPSSSTCCGTCTPCLATAETSCWRSRWCLRRRPCWSTCGPRSSTTRSAAPTGTRSCPGTVWGRPATTQARVLAGACARVLCVLAACCILRCPGTFVGQAAPALCPSSYRLFPLLLAGMSWCGYRPSDDPQTYGYNVPVNMYAQAAVERALELNRLVWRDADFEKRAAALAASLRKGGATSLGGGDRERQGRQGRAGHARAAYQGVGSGVSPLKGCAFFARPTAGCQPLFVLRPHAVVQASNSGALPRWRGKTCMRTRWMDWETSW